MVSLGYMVIVFVCSLLFYLFVSLGVVQKSFPLLLVQSSSEPTISAVCCDACEVETVASVPMLGHSGSCVACSCCLVVACIQTTFSLAVRCLSHFGSNAGHVNWHVCKWCNHMVSGMFVFL